MLPVFMLFLIPIGGGIPAGVLLGRAHGVRWPVLEVLYLVSDIVLACVFEPFLLFMIAAGKKSPGLARFTGAMKLAMQKTASNYGGPGMGPLALVMVAFGVDPMTGRAAAAAAGHGFFSGWAIAITGDMMYFTLIMVATLQVNSIIGDPNIAMGVILAGMIFGPMVFRRVKAAWAKNR